MKFRYKVLIINLIVISIALGTIGYLMIVKNFNLALEQQIENAVEENNLFQASIEYELLNILNTNSYSQNALMDKLSDAGENVYTNISANDSDLYVAYDNNIIYSSSSIDCDPSLWNLVDVGKKNYTIKETDGSYYISVSSCTLLLDKRLNVINHRDITSIYTMMKQQSDYYKLLLIIVLLVCSIFMYILSTLLTKPLEKLQRISQSFGDGDYDIRANIKSKDEIGMLADTYNNMADSVVEHMDELKDMVTRQEQFVADFTHELKTPMTSIIGYADTLRSRELTKEQQLMAASYIFSEGRRLESMSMKLFEFIYTKQHSISAKKLNVMKLMEEVRISVEPLLSAKEISLESNTVNCHILGDLDLLKSAFINLIDNARKASPEGSKIIFSCKQHTAKDDQAPQITISVKDFGHGIPKEHLDKICDAVYMVDKSRSRKEGGAGLGLSLSALIFDAHGATMKVDSVLNEGTEFSISFSPYSEEVTHNA
ncbi:MAG: HAMP domain-containing histidine kinase [Lachnospiraceae bacterium]|nr:HAMP domain-containing histidine kinase [Lachnospiraceae bacterium]